MEVRAFENLRAIQATVTARRLINTVVGYMNSDLCSPFCPWVAGIVTWLRAGRQRNRGSIPDGSMRFSIFQNVQTDLRAHTDAYLMETRGLCRGIKRPGREVITHCRVGPTLKWSGTVPPLP
jgi:hypothetical protein